MASKRTINRLYWVTVKAVANETLSARAVYRRALAGVSDSVIIPYLEKLEIKYGKHRAHTDLANNELWYARSIVDAIRTSTQEKTS